MNPRPQKPDKDWHPSAQYKEALLEFEPPAQEDEQRENLGFTKYKDPLVEEFLEYVATKGKPFFTWDVIRPFFLWKLQTVMNDMHLIEAEELTDDFQKESLIKNEKIKESKNFIMSKAREFDGTPFTIQRLCELLLTPRKHYKTTEKYLRALEKTINIVTTVTENGERVTGVENYEEYKEEQIPVERNFIVSVDELDDPLPGLSPMKSPIFNRIINESPITVTPERAMQEVQEVLSHIDENEERLTLEETNGSTSGPSQTDVEFDESSKKEDEGVPLIQAPIPPPEDPSNDEDPRAPPPTPDLERPIAQVRITDDEKPTLPSDLHTSQKKYENGESSTDFEPVPAKIARMEEEPNEPSKLIENDTKEEKMESD